MNPKNWSLTHIWDQAFNLVPEEIKPRGYLYASELGGSFIDTYYKMTGIQYSNAPTKVARQKMEAGKVWEAIVKFVLKRAGILKLCQEKVDSQLPGLLEVHGRLDFLAGGLVDLKQSEEITILVKVLFQELGMPEVYLQIADNVLRMVYEMRENGSNSVNLTEYVMDVKSVSNFVFELVQGQGKPSLGHKLQVFHYSSHLKYPAGRITYINRDDCRILELNVYCNGETFGEYSGWITQMTDYWNTGTEPPKEPLIIWNPVTCRFYKNTMGVEWSRYLTMIYGYASPNEFREHVTPLVSGGNRVLGRCAGNKKMTDKNRDMIINFKKVFPCNWDDLVDQAKAKGIDFNEDENLAL